MKGIRLGILTGIHLHIKLPIREVELGNPNLRFSVSFIKCRRCGAENVNCLKKKISSFSKRGVVM